MPTAITMNEQAKNSPQVAKSASRRSNSSTPPLSAKVSRLQEPRSKRQLTTQERIILLEGSKLNGFKFPPWASPLDDSEFELLPGQARYL